MRRRRRRPIVLPPVPSRAPGLTAQYRRDIRRARVSMAAWDQLPEEYRRFCAEYPRTATAVSLAQVLDQCDGDVALAKELLRELLPVRIA